MSDIKLLTEKFIECRNERDVGNKLLGKNQNRICKTHFTKILVSIIF